MANYFPLIVNPVTQRIEELPAGANLNLFDSNIVNVQNVYAGNIYADNITGNITVPGDNTQVIFNNNGVAGASANLTFDGTILTVIGNIDSNNANLGNIAIANNFIGSFSGNGSLLFELTAANLIGTAPLAAQVTESDQPNITSLGNLSSLTVIGNVNAANVPVLDLGNTQHLVISGGNSGYVLTTDGTGNVDWQAIVTDPGGSNTQVQYNDDGILSGSSNFTFNNTTNTLTLTGHLVANTFQMGSGSYQFFTTEVYLSSTSSIAPDQILYSVPASQVSSIDFVIISTDLSEGTRTSTKISATVLGTEVAYSEYAGIQINGGVGSFSVGYVPGNIGPPAVVLMCSPDSANYTTHNMLITKYAAL
jgi:hypothetical protein